MRPFHAAACLAALALAGCATSTESRVERSLVDAGLSRPLAGCMAERLVDRLSARQLQSLARLSALKDRDVGAMRVDDFLARIRGAADPEVYTVLTRAGIGCAIAG